MKRFIVLFGFILALTACGKSNDNMVNRAPSQDELAIAQLMEDMESAWNSKNLEAYSTYWHKDLRMTITDLKTKKNFVVDYNTFMELIPERMEKIGKIRFSGLKFRNISADKAKIFINLVKPDRNYPNYFNLVKNEAGDWQVISNEVVRR